MKKYDVIIIGAGSAGLAARREVAKKTDNYVVIDDGYHVCASGLYALKSHDPSG